MPTITQKRIQMFDTKDPTLAGTDTVFFVMKDGGYFLSHRLDLANYLHEKNVGLYLAADLKNSRKSFERLPYIRPIDLPFLAIFSRPWRMIFPILKLLLILIGNRKIIVFSATIPASVLMGIICRFFGIRHVALIAGLGNVFHGRPNLFRTFGQNILRYSLNKPRTKIIVQNASIGRLLSQYGFTPAPQLISGSGIDAFAYPMPARHPSNGRNIKFLMLGRMLREKGVVDFIEAAKMISPVHGAEFIIAGAPDPLNPTSLTAGEIEKLILGNSNIKWIGHCDDIGALLKTVDVVCLPSYHEGLPRTLLEGALSGCCLIASEIPGCTDVICRDEMGLLVPVKSPEKLASAFSHLIANPAKIAYFGINVREHVLKNFTNDNILPRYAKTILNGWENSPL